MWNWRTAIGPTHSIFPHGSHVSILAELRWDPLMRVRRLPIGRFLCVVLDFGRLPIPGSPRVDSPCWKILFLYPFTARVALPFGISMSKNVEEICVEPRPTSDQAQSALHLSSPKFFSSSAKCSVNGSPTM